VPAHSSKFVPGVVFSKESFSTAAEVVVTGAPLTRYLPLASTVPVIVVEAKALPVEATMSAAAPMSESNLCLNIFVPPIYLCN
jgi:hypothetical protein